MFTSTSWILSCFFIKPIIPKLKTGYLFTSWQGPDKWAMVGSGINFIGYMCSCCHWNTKEYRRYINMLFNLQLIRNRVMDKWYTCLTNKNSSICRVAQYSARYLVHKNITWTEIGDCDMWLKKCKDSWAVLIWEEIF